MNSLMGTLLNRREKIRRQALDHCAQIALPMLTCEAAISETCFLLRSTEVGVVAVMLIIERNVISLPFGLDIYKFKGVHSDFYFIPSSLCWRKPGALTLNRGVPGFINANSIAAAAR
jgi:hypothetical protein